MPYNYDVPFDFAFRKVNDWCANSLEGYPSGWPTFDQRTVGGTREYKLALIRPNTNAVYWRDVPASAMGYPDPRDFRVRLTKAHDYAREQEEAHGYPNFHQQIYPGSGLVYGTFLVNVGYADYYNPTSSELGLGSDPRTQTLDEWFRRAQRYAEVNGYAIGKPNGHWGFHSGVWHVGVHLFRSAYATSTWRSRSSLGYPSPTSTSGEASIAFSRPYPDSDPFFYRGGGLPVGVPTSSPCTINSVTNIAQDVNGNRTFRLRIWVNPWINPDNALVYPNQTVTFWHVPTVDDVWEARAENVSATLLRDHVGIKLTWVSP